MNPGIVVAYSFTINGTGWRYKSTRVAAITYYGDTKYEAKKFIFICASLDLRHTEAHLANFALKRKVEELFFSKQ